MENSTSPVEEPDSVVDGSEVNPKRRRVGEAINQTVQEWIRRRSLRQDENYFIDTSSDSEDGETRKKAGRVRRFLRLFFGNHVKREPLPEADVSSQEQPLEALVPRSDDSPAREVREVPLDPLPAIQYEQSAPVSPRQPDSPQAEELVPLHPEERPHTPIDHTASVPSAIDTPSMAPREKERVVIDRSRQTAIEADLKAAERRNRKRQRKQKQDLQHTKHQLKKVETAQKQKIQEQAAAQTVMEAKQKEVQPVVERTTEKPPTPVVPIERQAKQSDNPAQSVKEILEKRIKPSIEQPPTALPQDLPKARYEALQPEAVLKTVEKAAEENVAIEGLFERRHETKDVDNASTVQANTASVPTSPRPVKSSTQPFLSPQLPPTPPVALPTGAPQTSQPDATLSADYKRAAHKGFWAAVLLLIFIAVMALLT